MAWRTLRSPVMTLRKRLNLVLAALSAAFVAVLLVAEARTARVSIDEEITAEQCVFFFFLLLSGALGSVASC